MDIVVCCQLVLSSVREGVAQQKVIVLPPRKKHTVRKAQT